MFCAESGKLAGEGISWDDSAEPSFHGRGLPALNRSGHTLSDFLLRLCEFASAHKRNTVWDSLAFLGHLPTDELMGGCGQLRTSLVPAITNHMVNECYLLRFKSA